MVQAIELLKLTSLSFSLFEVFHLEALLSESQRWLSQAKCHALVNCLGNLETLYNVRWTVYLDSVGAELLLGFASAHCIKCAKNHRAAVV